LTLDELKALPAADLLLTLECIGNPAGGDLIGNCAWTGCYLRELLDRVKVKPEASRAGFTAADGYETSVDLSWVLQPGVLLAYAMNGEPLPPEHGYPLRLRIPGLYGQKQPKWIERIEFTDEIRLGYWEKQGWSDTAAAQTNSKFDQPRALDRLPAGSVPLFGVAFAGLREITRVEVRIDAGEWQAASLLSGGSPEVWTQWSFDWTARPGAHTLRVRATDAKGFTQSVDADRLLDGAYPDGSDRIHNIAVTVA
jgi:hypothetical protein